MTPERWQQVKALFHSALELAPERRAAFLDAACNGQNSLRKEVESLITAHEETGSFIDSPAYEKGLESLLDAESEMRVGQQIGSYEIISLLGRGGMGEVYLALDKRLQRRVALKVLPALFTKDAERLERFEREARAASALNHPNIITIHEIAEADSLHFIATEFIEGETLREHLSHNRPGINETLHIIIQIADALAAAHKTGIIHRDIKPENIMLRPDGYVKILDFGLAKLVEQQASEQASDAPTRRQFNTSPGMVMGTASYMSPEQARGLEVDARTDIWSLGVVFYEMLSGRVPFEGTTISHVIVNILEKEPPWAVLSTGVTPAELEWIVKKALRKDREERYQTARELLGDLRSLKQRLEFQAELERTTSPEDSVSLRSENEKGFVTGNIKTAAETGEVQPARSTVEKPLAEKAGYDRRWLVLAALALVVGATLFAAYRFFGQRLLTRDTQAGQSSSEQFSGFKTTQVTAWPGLDIYPSFSPDGNSIAYSSDHEGAFEIYIKQLTPGGSEIRLTADAQQNFQPAWSPDGKLIAYYSKNRGGIWVVPAFGGAARQLTNFGSQPSWSPDSSQITFQSGGLFDLGQTSSGVLPPSTIWIIKVQDGTSKQLTQTGNPVGGHGAPSWSPDGKRIVFINSSLGVGGAVWSVSSTAGELRQLSKKPGFDPVYTPDGESIYYIGGSGAGSEWALWKLRISKQSGEPLGEPIEIRRTGDTAFKHLRISADGKKLACSAELLINNLWSIPVAPASGEATGTPLSLTRDKKWRKAHVVFSPDGKKIAFSSSSLGSSGDIWVMDTDGTNQVQLTSSPAHDNSPTWFPDGNRIAYATSRRGDNQQERGMLRVVELQTRSDQPLLEIDPTMSFFRVSPDGKQIAFNSDRSGAINIWTMPVAGGEPAQLTFDPEFAGFACWSPDGRFIGFEIKRRDDTHLMVMPSGGGEPVQLTFDQGQSLPHSWSPDGERLAFAGQRKGIWNVWWVSVKDKKEKQLTDYTKLNAYVRYPAWSPRGDQIVYEYSETTGNILIVDLK